MKGANGVGEKNGANRLAQCRVATDLSFAKKMQYLQSTIKRDAIK